MAPSHLPRLRPVVSLLCLALLIALSSHAESAGKPYLLIQHQVYEEHQEVLGKGSSNRSAVSYRKNDEEELFDFIKDYLFNRGGAQKLNTRGGSGRAQFVGVDSGGANGSAASAGAVKDSSQSGQRYKMHIIKFRLVNASHPAIAAARNAQEPFHKEHHPHGGGEHPHGGGEHPHGGGEHPHGGGEHPHGGGESYTQGYRGNSTLPSHHWSGRHRTSHPTHVTTAHTEPPPALPRRAAQAAAAGNCELPETTKRTTKIITTITTTTRHTTTTRRTTTTTTTTTTPKPTTTTKRTTTCAPTTVTVVGCERAPPAPTTKMTTTTRRTTTTTTTEAPKVYLHGHPYVVIKLHEVNGTRRVPSDRFPPLPSYLRLLLANGTYPNRTHQTRHNSSHVPEHRIFWLPEAGWPEAGEGASGGSASGHQPKGKKQLHNQHQQQQHQQQRSRSRRMPAYAAETAALKREVAGNLMRVLRTIRKLDSMAEESQQDGLQQEEDVQEQQLVQPDPLQQQAPSELVAPDTAAEIDRFLRRRDKTQGLRSQNRVPAEYLDELKENRAEEGDLHQFSILLKKALDELSVQPDAKTRTTSKPHKAAAAAVYR